jgi:hypothetical protein
MASLTSEAQEVIARNGLGTPTAIYKPNTVGGVFGALFIMAFCVAWTVFALLIFNQASAIPLSTGSSIFQIFRIVFPLFGVVLTVVAFVSLIRTILNHNSRAIICAHGVACITSKRADAVRWRDILTVTHKVDVTRTTHQYQSGGSYTTTSVSHKFTVHCQDGRKILFDKTSCGRKVQELGETIQVELARRGIK